MKKTVLIILICLILAGTIMVCLKGFNVGLPYRENINISVYVGKKIEDKDMKTITNEVFKGKSTMVQKVELFEDMISITTEEMSAEELNELYSDFFEKLESNLRGRNASLKEVTTSLQFDESLEGYPFEITYEPENSDYIQWDGQLGTAWGHMSSEEVIDTEILVTAEHGAYSRSRIYEIRLKGKKKDVSLTKAI